MSNLLPSGLASIDVAAHNSLQTSLATLLWLQLLLLVVHDTLPLGRWNNLQHFRRVVPLRRRIIGTAVNSLTGVLALGLYSLERTHQPWPLYTGLIILEALLFAGELRSWWWPWFFGASAETVAHLRPNWEGTIAFLPERNGLRINAMHVLLHIVTLAVLVLAMTQRWHRG